MVKIGLVSDQKRPIWLLTTDDKHPVGHLHYRFSGRSHKWRPPTDVYETDDSIIVRVEIAGMRESEFTITLTDRVLTIQGYRQDNDARRAFHQMEIRFGEFSTEIGLHWSIDADAVDAEYNDGILRLVLPKTKPHPIKLDK